VITLVLIVLGLGLLFLVGLLVADYFEAGHLPFSCPVCAHGGDENLAGQHQHWYVWIDNERLRCRHCNQIFKEHPSGALVKA
jgi:YD repeat-containing protein